MAKSFSLKLVIKGSILSVFTALLLAIIYGILLSFTSLTENDIVFAGIYCLSVFIGGFYAANQSGMKGIYYGIAVGICYVFFLMILAAIISPIFPAWIKISEKLLFSILAGGIGGIAGVFFRR